MIISTPQNSGEYINQSGIYVSDENTHNVEQPKESGNIYHKGIVATKLDKFVPQCERKSTAKELALLKLSCGYRNCTDSFLDKLINYYLIAIVAVILFIILTIEPVNKIICELIPGKTQAFIFKAVIFFIVIYLVDRWVEHWREHVTFCHIGI